MSEQFTERLPRGNAGLRPLLADRYKGGRIAARLIGVGIFHDDVRTERASPGTTRVQSVSCIDGTEVASFLV